MEEDENIEVKQPLPLEKNRLFYILIFVFGILILAYFFLKAPANNKIETIHISSGESLVSISSDLKEKRIVNSTFLLKIFVSLFKSDRQITKGDYLFNKNLPVFSIAWQLSRGQHNINPIKVTFKEGITNEEIAMLLSQKLPNFDKNTFLNDNKTKQGYLFPDTYFFFPLTSTVEVTNDLSYDFKKRIASISKDIDSSNKTLKDVIIMSSILEKEAHGKDDSSLISGILWNRIEKGMLLQVDAAPSTYKVKGLPDEPIDNPGLSSILAALHPTNSSYFYYLHDKNGVAHFSVTYKEHMKNINRYLK